MTGISVIPNAVKPLGRSLPLRRAMRATSPASTGEHTPGRESLKSTSYFIFVFYVNYI